MACSACRMTVLPSRRLTSCILLLGSPAPLFRAPSTTDCARCFPAWPSTDSAVDSVSLLDKFPEAARFWPTWSNPSPPGPEVPAGPPRWNRPTSRTSLSWVVSTLCVSRPWPFRRKESAPFPAGTRWGRTLHTAVPSLAVLGELTYSRHQRRRCPQQPVQRTACGSWRCRNCQVLGRYRSVLFAGAAIGKWCMAVDGWNSSSRWCRRDRVWEGGTQPA